ncbi:MAG: glycosyltransferase family 2 protein [Elusimicrobia bacterium]|nr:glycosyltransferase family 2 protein [Candidatus Liberimonas magnetica]
MLLSIVIPVYNEKENLKELYKQLKAVDIRDYEIIIVDDGSTDGSLELLKEISKKDSSVKIIVHRKNYGQTAALFSGFSNAIGDWIATLDADLQNDAADIPKMLAKAKEGYDVVSGWRKDRKDSFFFRSLPSIMANYLISVITGVKLHDYGCTLKVYKRELIQKLAIYGEMHRFLPAYLSWQGAKLYEMEVVHHERLSGKSHYGFGRVFKVILDLFVAKFFFSYLTKPIYVFGGVSLASFVLSVLAAGIVVIRKIFFEGAWISPLIFVFFFLLGVSVLCLLLGLLAEILIRIYFESKDKIPYHTKEKINI